jgi:hypothetical protein
VAGPIFGVSAVHATVYFLARTLASSSRVRNFALTVVLLQKVAKPAARLIQQWEIID